MNRRTCLSTLAAAPFAFAEEEAGLAEAAARRGIVFGATPEIDMGRAPEGYTALMARHAKLIAPILSWRSVSKNLGEYDYSRQQGTLDFVRAHDMEITGAHLLWHLSTPEYFNAAPDRAAAEKLIREHILAIGKHFAGQVYSWNVVNEALNPREGRPGGMRQTPYLEKLGTAYFDLAFRTAREADPGALLVYNDYDMEYDRPDQEARRRALLNLLDSFQQRKLPVAAIGLQAHLRLGQPFREELYRKFLREIAARGVKILITELDIRDHAAPSDVAQRDQAVADAYAQYLAPALDEPAVAALVLWGLSDRYSWLTMRKGPQYDRADGLPARPLPFDTEYRPKPAYWAVLKALETAPKR